MADIFESWHYPLIGFMDDIEDYFDTTMRNRLDGDTLIEMQYYVLNEFHLYGSSRLGIYEASDTTLKVQRLYNFSRSGNEITHRLSTSTTKYNKFATDSTATLMHGNKKYEGVNHLGNVLVVYSDKRLIGACNADTVTFYKADLIAATDYSPFGAPIKQWYANDDTSGYKFGFNGKELDKEGLGGGGFTYDYGFRIYNPQLAKFLSVDPLFQSYPWYTPYQFAGNSPIYFVDLDGLEELPNFYINELKRKGEAAIKKVVVNFIISVIESVVNSSSGSSQQEKVIPKNDQNKEEDDEHSKKGGSGTKNRPATKLENFLLENVKDQKELKRIAEAFAGTNPDGGFDHTVTTNNMESNLKSQILSDDVIFKVTMVWEDNGDGTYTAYFRGIKDDVIKANGNSAIEGSVPKGKGSLSIIKKLEFNEHKKDGLILKKGQANAFFKADDDRVKFIEDTRKKLKDATIED